MCRHACERPGRPGITGNHNMQELPFAWNRQERSIHQQLLGGIIAGIHYFRAQAGAFSFWQILEYIHAGMHLQGDVAGDTRSGAGADAIQEVCRPYADGVVGAFIVFPDYIDARSMVRAGAAQVLFVIALAAVPGDAGSKALIVQGSFHPGAKELHIPRSHHHYILSLEAVVVTKGLQDAQQLA